MRSDVVPVRKSFQFGSGDDGNIRRPSIAKADDPGRVFGPALFPLHHEEQNKPRVGNGEDIEPGWAQVGALSAYGINLPVRQQADVGVRCGSGEPPYQAPVTGISPGDPPNVKFRSGSGGGRRTTVMLPTGPTRKLPFMSSIQRWPCRKMPGLLLPSPFQSPATGTSPGAPP